MKFQVLAIFLKFNIRPPVNIFMFLTLYFMLDRLAKDGSRMVFEGGFFGGMRKIWGNPYLNSTTVLFDLSLYLR